MNRLKTAALAFIRILRADEWSVVTIRGDHYCMTADIQLKHLRNIAANAIDEVEGQRSALNEAKTILNQ